MAATRTNHNATRSPRAKTQHTQSRKQSCRQILPNTSTLYKNQDNDRHRRCEHNALVCAVESRHWSITMYTHATIVSTGIGLYSHIHTQCSTAVCSEVRCLYGSLCVGLWLDNGIPCYELVRLNKWSIIEVHILYPSIPQWGYLVYFISPVPMQHFPPLVPQHRGRERQTEREGKRERKKWERQKDRARETRIAK